MRVFLLKNKKKKKKEEKSSLFFLSLKTSGALDTKFYKALLIFFSFIYIIF